MKEVVLDTNVIVAAFRSRNGASYKVVRSIGSPEWRPNLSVALALEYEDVLKRKGILPGSISERDVDDFLDYVFQKAHLVPFVLRCRPSLSDPNDERILEVAVQCGAMIITHNGRDFVAAERFGVQVLTPAEFLMGSGHDR